MTASVARATGRTTLPNIICAHLPTRYSTHVTDSESVRLYLGRLRARGAAEGTGEKNKKNKRACGVGPAVPRPYFILLPPYGPLLQVPLLRCRPPRGACAAAARRGRGAVGGRVRVRCAACCGVLTGRTAS